MKNFCILKSCGCKEFRKDLKGCKCGHSYQAHIKGELKIVGMTEKQYKAKVPAYLRVA